MHFRFLKNISEQILQVIMTRKMMQYKHEEHEYDKESEMRTVIIGRIVIMVMPYNAMITLMAVMVTMTMMTVMK